MFDVDFQRIVYNLSPHFLRETKLLEWMYSMVRPLRTLNLVFQSKRNNTLYFLQFTGQVIYLEHTLNDLFDPIGRGIFIDDTSNIDYDYVFRQAEQNNELFVRRQAEGASIFLRRNVEFTTAIHFIVKIPVAVSFDEVAVRAVVDSYRQAGKNYTVETF